MLNNYKDKIRILSRKKGVVSSSLLYEIIGLLNIATSSINCKISITAIVLNIYALSNILLDYLRISNNYDKYKYLEEHKKEFDNLKDLYNNYIDKIVNELKKIKFNNLLELCITLDVLLTNGMFSYNKKYSYQSYEENNEYMNELLGTFVITGHGVCRHNTSFIDDILSKLDIKTVKIICSSIDKKNPNHILLGIIEDNNIFGYDFTSHFPIYINGNNLETPFSDNKLSLCYVEMDKKEFRRLKPIFITGNDFFLTLLNAEDKILSLNKSLSIFNKNNNDLLGEISSKTLKLMPRGNEKDSKLNI